MTGLEAVQPILDITRTPSNLARANMARAGEAAVSCAAIERRSGFEAGDIQHVSDGQQLVSVGWHVVVLSLAGVQDVPTGGVRRYSVPHSWKFTHG